MTDWHEHFDPIPRFETVLFAILTAVVVYAVIRWGF